MRRFLSKTFLFSLEEMVKDVGVKMLKRESRNSVLSFHAPFYLLHVLNDINDCLTEENGENDEIGVNLRELCIEEKEIDSNPSDECLEEEQ